MSAAERSARAIAPVRLSAASCSNPQHGRRNVKKLWLLFVAVVLAVTAGGDPASAAGVLTGKLYFEKVAVTATTAASSPLPDPGVGAQKYYITDISIYNAGTNEVFVALGEAATSGKAEIAPGSTLNISGQAAATTTINLICSTAETSTVYLYATLGRP